MGVTTNVTDPDGSIGQIVSDLVSKYHAKARHYEVTGPRFELGWHFPQVRLTAEQKRMLDNVKPDLHKEAWNFTLDPNFGW